MGRPNMIIVTEVAPYSDGPAGVHGVLPQAAEALSELATLAGLDPMRPSGVRGIEADALTHGGVLALFTIGETPWSDAQRVAIVDGVRSGRLAVLGVHAATDACRAWDDYGVLLGGRFDGHPWTTTFDVEVVDRSHPSVAHLGDRFSWHDEVYLFSDLRPDAHVLLRVADGQLDMSVPGARTPPSGFPLAWCFSEGRGPVFYTSLGHFPGAWETPFYLRHLAGGLSWLLDQADVGD